MFHVKHSALFLVAVAALALTGCAGVSQPTGWAAPVFAGNLLLVREDGGSLSALNLNNGSGPPTVVWTYPPRSETDRPWYTRIFSSESQGGALGALYATPRVERIGDQQRVFLVGYTGAVVALDLTNGTVVNGWPQNLNVGGHVVATPGFDGKRLYIATHLGTVVPVNATDGAMGSPLIDVAARIWSEPAVAGGALLVGTLDHHLRALDTASGVSRWDVDLDGAIAGDPTVSGDTILVPTLQSRLYALDLTAQGAERWQFKGDNWFWSRPVVSSGVVFAATSVGTVYALDFATGEPRWTNPFQLGSEVRAAPVLVDGTLVIAASNGLVVGLDPATGAERWRKEHPKLKFLANPLVQDSVILLAAQNGSVIRIRPQDQGSSELLFERG